MDEVLYEQIANGSSKIVSKNSEMRHLTLTTGMVSEELNAMQLGSSSFPLWVDKAVLSTRIANRSSRCG
jgi:hypothetical protein